MASGRLEHLNRSAREDRELTIYVKGFLFGGEPAGDFAPWLASHRALEQRLGWQPAAAGWIWQADGPAFLPLPVAAATRFAWDVYRSARLARSVSIVSHLGFALAEVAGRFVVQYAHAGWSAAETAASLGEEIGRLTRSGVDVRLVAHSLGCLPAVQASARLAPTERPREVHLLAPACTEDAVAEQLGSLARERTALYYCPGDPVLSVGFRALALRSALGQVGPRREYRGLTAIDASPWLSALRAHGDYKHRLAELIAGHHAARARIGLASEGEAREPSLDALARDPSSEA